MNVYSTASFRHAFQTAYYPDRTVELQPFQLGDRVWQLPVVQGKKPIVLEPFQTAFIDFYEAEADQRPTPEMPKVGYLPRACHGMVSVQEWHDQNLAQRYEPSPTVFLQELQGWQMSKRTLRSYRKLEKEVGPIRFQFSDPDPEVIATCMRWKSAQYQKTGCADHFSQAAHVRLFQALEQSGLLLVSSLRAGDQLLAVHLGMAAAGRAYWWVPSYDADYSKYAPGKILLELLIEGCLQQNYQEFDFLIGGEDYKWDYATHIRLIGELGVRPLSLRTQQAALATKAQGKAIALACLKPFPGVRETLKGLRDQAKRRIKPTPTEDAIALMLQENA